MISNIHEDFWGVGSRRKAHPKGSIKWKRHGKHSYDGESVNGKYDFNIRKEKYPEGYFWVLDIFDANIKDASEAQIDSVQLPTLESAMHEAEGWI